MPVHIEEHSLESDIHLSMNLLGNRHGDRIAGLNTGEPSSQTLHSTFPHCPKACKLQSMSWDTPVIRTNIEMEFLKYILSIAMRWSIFESHMLNSQSKSITKMQVKGTEEKFFWEEAINQMNSVAIFLKMANLPEQCYEKLCLLNCNSVGLQMTTALHPSCTSQIDHIFRNLQYCCCTSRNNRK